jgi:Lamin Tail Domain
VRPGWPATAFALGLAAALAAPGASADPESDSAAVHGDFAAHGGDITACKFTREQLVNARNLETEQDAYTGFDDEVNREIQRWDTGGCSSGGGGGSSKKADFHIVAIKGKVRSRNKRKEYVTIRNKGGKEGNLKRWSLRDRSGHRIRFRRSVRVRAHRRLRVITGCAKGHRRAFRRGARYYACRKHLIWNDRGDVARLISPRGRLISQRGFGRFRFTRRF